MEAAKKRTKVPDAAVQELESLYSRGMVGSGKDYDKLIDEAVQQTGLERKQVKV